MQKWDKFKHFTTEDGLSQNSIYCILQDKRGFLWIGTENGLNRYDGYGFVQYESESDDPGTLSNNTVLSICQDRAGTLWVGTSDGLNRFDRLHETFTRFKSDPEEPGGLSSDRIFSIFEDRSGILWIGTLKGLNRYNKEKGAFDHWIHHPEDPESLSNDEVTAIVEVKVKRGRYELWVGTGNGLCKFNREKGIFKGYPVNPGGKGSNSVKALCADRSGILWVGTESGGLSRFDLEQERVTAHYKNDPKKPDCLSHNEVESIFFDKKSNKLWIGTHGGGLDRFDPQTGTFIHYKENPAIPTSLSNDIVYTVYEDDGGIIWVGTEGGLNKLDKKKNEFRHFTLVPGDKNSLNHKFVWAICKDRSGIVWVGTNKGLNRIDRSGRFTHYTHNPGTPGTLSEGHVISIFEDSSGVLWAGTNKGILNKFNRKTGTFTHYPLSEKWIKSIIEDRWGVLWVGASDGLYKSDRKKETFTSYKNDSSEPKRLSSSNVSCVVEDGTNVLWVGTRGGGLNRFNRDTETFTCYKHDTSNPDSLGGDVVTYIYKDSRETVWVGIYQGGLNKLVDREKMIFKHYRKNEINGLPDNSVFGILEDHEGNLWISTYNGLSKFNTGNETFRNYDARDGLQSNEFNGRACFRGDDGEMLFGGTNGFNAFYPQRITGNKHKAPVVITGFRVFNKPFCQESVTEKEEIVLTHEQTVFSFEFAALDFSTPGKNRYLHKMEKVDPDWVQGDATKRFATYTKLSHGSYIFRLIGSNNDGIWNEGETTIRIIITPPWWKRWWFRVLLSFASLLVLLGAFHMRTRRLRNKLAEQKRVQKMLKDSHDEMERARYLAEIRNAENEKLLTAISVIFMAVDANGFIFQWNKPSERFFRIPREKAMKNRFIKVLKNCVSEEKLNEIIKKGLKQEKSSKEVEISVDLSSQGKGIKLLSSAISPVIDRTGKNLGFILLAEDVTNRKEEEMRRNLSKKLESLGQMTSGVAHEIKTPLQYIEHNARFVTDSFKDVVKFYKTVDDALPRIEKSDKKRIGAKIKQIIDKSDMEFIMEEIPKASDQIIEGVNKVSEIVKSMTEFSYPGRGVREKSDINGLLKSTLVMMRNRIKKNADIRLDLFKELPHISCYPAELNQVFFNILVNAVDAVAESGKWGLIRISTYLDGNEVVISISDSGTGIPESHRDNIFDPFFTTKEVGKGTGQGLSLVHNVIVEKHKGKVDFTSETDKGTTFFIRLPLDIEGEH